MLKNALETLNAQQKQAVLHHQNPLLILAGAGSGKTRVITHKIAWFIEEHGVDPRSILAVTFTNKAANELRERATALSERAERVQIRTFHSFGAWLLRRNSHALGLADNFNIYDDNDSLALLAYLYPDISREQLRFWNNYISRAKDNNTDSSNADYFENEQLREVFNNYQAALDRTGNVDFGDLIVKPIHLLKNEELIAERIRSRFQIILVDEYQDSNHAQCELLQNLHKKGNYICVVGDDDQSIYKFRGAEVRNIIAFPDHFFQADVIKLEQNYRSTGAILGLASSVVKKNEARYQKTLWTDNEDGKKPTLAGFYNEDEELNFILSLIHEDNFEGTTAILYRTNAQSRKYETYFTHEQIPYKIIGTLRFFDREEVKDVVAFLKLIANSCDTVALARIINKPSRGIGKVSEGKILRELSTSTSVEQALNRVLSTAKGFNTKTRTGIQSFQAILAEANTLLETQLENLATYVQALIRLSGLGQYYLEQDEIAGSGKIQNLEELMNVASLYPCSREGLVEFLEAVELDSMREQNDIDANIILITMHNTKGLEFDRVIITGLEEGQFPRNTEAGELEEERRLFYVAITRARKELYLFYCAQRQINGRYMYLSPSPFLEGLDSAGIDFYNFTPASELRADPWRQWHSERIHQQTEEDKGEFPPGQAVYHDDYGTGQVIKSSHNGRNEVILVRFESGKTATFMPKYTQIEKISLDS